LNKPLVIKFRRYKYIAALNDEGILIKISVITFYEPACFKRQDVFMKWEVTIKHSVVQIPPKLFGAKDYFSLS